MKLRGSLFGRELELRVRLFHLLALAGILVSICVGVGALFTDVWVAVAGCFTLCAFAVGLLAYSIRTGRYQRCYLLTVIVIFMAGFSVMFFVGGGYLGGMPLFFIFAVVFTAFLIEGRSLAVLIALELCIYSADILLAYFFPQFVIWHASRTDIAIDFVVCTIVVALSLSASTVLEVSQYRLQQRELERARREAEEASRAKGAFLANMSHEIRTPLNIILGMNEIVQRETNSPEVRECADHIQAASELLQGLVGDVLDMSRIESGKMELVSEVYRTGDLIATLSLVGEARCQKKGLSFRVDADKSLSPLLRGDVRHIQQIGANFLSNAAKYTQRGGVTLTVSQKPGAGPEEVLLCIRVADTGVGIAPEALPTLFDAFTRADLSAHRNIEGSGLGLAIAKELTERMGGRIFVESAYGTGSAFWVELPQAVAQAAAQTAPAPVAERTFTAPEGRVLAVDDNAENLFVIRSLLRRTRVRVDTAQSGREAVEAVRSGRYHVILLDYMMPEMDGVETLRQLRALPGFDTPAVALTADAVAGTERMLLDAGFSAYAAKPVTGERLERLLLDYLPPELVTAVELERTDAAETAEQAGRLAGQLRPYGLELDKALEYFGGDLSQCSATAALFLRHYGGERRRVEELWSGGDYAALRYPVHALKSKAKNMGADRLCAVCAQVEALCEAGDAPEAESLLPHLCYLWDRAREGLRLLTDELDGTTEEKPPLSREDCLRELPGLLQSLRRQPSLDRLEALLETEPGERRALEQAREAVLGFDFEEAERLFAAYVDVARGGRADGTAE